jgi:CRP-like cAMP-binding protein
MHFSGDETSMPINSCGLSGEDLQKIRARADRMVVKARECVFFEGDEADCIYFIESECLRCPSPIGLLRPKP